ncbi:hypothetical protein ABZX30_36575 [Streptomyces sp. NPDC004542]|uniref:hypothetical protein n=1 Tax=Streptomyces sp. NPDC004542 TaxID=3154281 RepID=UPI0033AD2541
MPAVPAEPGDALEPSPPTVVISPPPAEVAPPRDVLLDRPMTFLDLMTYLSHAVANSDSALKRFLRAAAGLALIFVGLIAAMWVTAIVLYALVHAIAPGDTPSLRTLMLSVFGTGGFGTFVLVYRRIRRWFRNRQTNSTTAATATTPAAPAAPAAPANPTTGTRPQEPEPPTAGTGGQQP